MKYFNENMTYSEAQKTLFTIMPNKSTNEQNDIMLEYKEMLFIISHKEQLENELTLTSYSLI